MDLVAQRRQFRAEDLTSFAWLVTLLSQRRFGVAGLIPQLVQHPFEDIPSAFEGQGLVTWRSLAWLHPRPGFAGRTGHWPRLGECHTCGDADYQGTHTPCPALADCRVTAPVFDNPANSRLHDSLLSNDRWQKRRLALRRQIQQRFCIINSDVSAGQDPVVADFLAQSRQTALGPPRQRMPGQRRGQQFGQQATDMIEPFPVRQLVTKHAGPVARFCALPPLVHQQDGHAPPAPDDGTADFLAGEQLNLSGHAESILGDLQRVAERRGLNRPGAAQQAQAQNEPQQQATQQQSDRRSPTDQPDSGPRHVR